MKTIWKVTCLDQQVCPAVRKSLTDAGFELVKETPNAIDSDLIMVINLEEEKNIPGKAKEVFKICGKKVQSLSVSHD